MQLFLLNPELYPVEFLADCRGKVDILAAKAIAEITATNLNKTLKLQGESFSVNPRTLHTGPLYEERDRIHQAVESDIEALLTDQTYRAILEEEKQYKGLASSDQPIQEVMYAESDNYKRGGGSSRIDLHYGWTGAKEICEKHGVTFKGAWGGSLLCVLRGGALQEGDRNDLYRYIKAVIKRTLQGLDNVHQGIFPTGSAISILDNLVPFMRSAILGRPHQSSAEETYTKMLYQCSKPMYDHWQEKIYKNPMSTWLLEKLGYNIVNEFGNKSSRAGARDDNPVVKWLKARMISLADTLEHNDLFPSFIGLSTFWEKMKTQLDKEVSKNPNSIASLQYKIVQEKYKGNPEKIAAMMLNVMHEQTPAIRAFVKRCMTLPTVITDADVVYKQLMSKDAPDIATLREAAAQYDAQKALEDPADATNKTAYASYILVELYDCMHLAYQATTGRVSTSQSFEDIRNDLFKDCAPEWETFAYRIINTVAAAQDAKRRLAQTVTQDGQSTDPEYEMKQLLLHAILDSVTHTRPDAANSNANYHSYLSESRNADFAKKLVARIQAAREIIDEAKQQSFKEIGSNIAANDNRVSGLVKTVQTITSSVLTFFTKGRS